ncbi:MAG: mismatch repair protein Vsr [Verrucomicrobia bacterium]|nr:mismatch repair protein Vsr [Verrucomicrobiota bacterium]
MADVFTPEKRSLVMAAIRSRGNKATEIRLIKVMQAHGITGWRRHHALFGRPDFVFPRARVAVFVDGCFWHGCPRHFKSPAARADFWSQKIGRNRARDRKVTRELVLRGWTVIRIWEHALTKRLAARTVARLRRVVTRDGSAA